MGSVLVRENVRAQHHNLNEHLSAEDSRRDGLRNELSRIDKEFDALVAAMKVGILSDTPQSEFERLKRSKRAIEQDLATEAIEAPPTIGLHPNVAEIYQKKVENPTEALKAEETRTEASEIIRRLIDETRVVLDDDELCIHLKDELAEMPAQSTSKRLRSRGSGLKTTLAAGARYSRDRHLLVVDV
ncbi:MAG: hypothetical protein OXQ29_25240 [Rhodospirillaceae bacterium]|nr:hypothetical protein [Rhodospirillaceae bacterium]